MKNKVNKMNNLQMNENIEEICKKQINDFFGMEFQEIKGKSISVEPSLDNSSSFDYGFSGTVTGFKSYYLNGTNGNEKFGTYLQVEDSEGNTYDVTFSEVIELNGYDFEDIRVDYAINFKDGFTYQGEDHYSIDEGSLTQLKHFLDSCIGDDVDELNSKIDEIYVCHYANHLNEETDPIELTGRDHEISVDSLYS